MIKESGNHKGAVAEAKIAAAAIELGVRVLKPMSEHGRYDLVFDVGQRRLRVQCKWANRKGDVVSVYVGGSYLSPNGYVRSTYARDEVDAIAVYCGELDQCFQSIWWQVSTRCTCGWHRHGMVSGRDYTLPTSICSLGL